MRKPPVLLLTLLVLAALPALLLPACESGDLTLDEADPDAVPLHPTYEQVYAIVNRECTPCHEGSDDEEDDGDYALAPKSRVVAEDDAPLETCTDIVALRNDILEQIDSDSMPPGAWPRLTSEQKLLIRRWIDDGAPAPCN